MSHTHDVPETSAGGPAAHLQVDADYQELTRQHHALDERLSSFAALEHLSAAQRLEELTLKKKKLAIKDRIAALAASKRR